jgi:hypothetical protein
VPKLSGPQVFELLEKVHVIAFSMISLFLVLVVFRFNLFFYEITSYHLYRMCSN